jgi:hypothetical protein
VGDKVGERTAESSRLGILGTHPTVFVRMANKGDKLGQRTGMGVRPERTMAIIREG